MHWYLLLLLLSTWGLDCINFCDRSPDKEGVFLVGGRSTLWLAGKEVVYVGTCLWQKTQMILALFFTIQSFFQHL